MIKIYRKTTTIKAERFDGSKEMAKRYGAELYSNSGYGYAAVEGEPDGDGYVLDTLKGELLVRIGDWIIQDGEDINVIADDVFKNKYAELPVIPKAVADWIEAAKHGGTDMSNPSVINAAIGAVEYDQSNYEVAGWIRGRGNLFARAWLDGYQVEK